MPPSARSLAEPAGAAGIAELPELPFITVVVPVRNERRFIGDTLGQLLAQDYPREQLEILVCDGMSDDGTREIVGEVAARHPQVRLFDNPRRLSSSGRNVGFRAARGEIVLVVDGHVLIDNDQLLRSVARCFRQTGAECLGRPQPLVAVQGSAWSEAIAEARASWLGHSNSSFIFSEYEGFAPAASVGAAYHRSVFGRVGLVDEAFDACEDLEFNTRLDRAGMRCYVSPSLRVRYYARTSLGGLFRQMHRYGYGRYKYLRKHPSSLTVGQLLPPLVVAGLALLPLAPLFSRRLFGAGLLAAGGYAGVIAGASAGLARRRGVRHLLRYPVIYFCVHLALGAGFWHSLFKGGRTGGRDG